MPRRIQMRRRKGGWRKDNPDAVIVARPSKWGNPWAVGSRGVNDRDDAKHEFNMWAHDCMDPRVTGSIFDGLHELRGKDLACWCPLCDRHKDGKPFGEQCPDCAPCHADVLGDLANREKAHD